LRLADDSRRRLARVPSATVGEEHTSGPAGSFSREVNMTITNVIEIIVALALLYAAGFSRSEHDCH
jgi:hypothetical protein